MITIYSTHSQKECTVWLIDCLLIQKFPVTCDTFKQCWRNLKNVFEFTGFFVIYISSLRIVCGESGHFTLFSWKLNVKFTFIIVSSSCLLWDKMESGQEILKIIVMIHFVKTVCRLTKRDLQLKDKEHYGTWKLMKEIWRKSQHKPDVNLQN